MIENLVVPVVLIVALILGAQWLLGRMRKNEEAKLAGRAALLGPCPHCGTDRAVKARMTPLGIVLILVGLLLAPIGIGFLLIFVGVTQKTRRAWCPRCGAFGHEVSK